MTQYRIAYLDARGRVFAAESIQSETEMGAIRRAQSQKHSWNASYGFELWRGDRCIYTERSQLSA